MNNMHVRNVTHPPETPPRALLNQSNHAYEHPAISLCHSDTPIRLSRIAPSFCDKANHFRLSAAVVPRLTTTLLPTTKGPATSLLSESGKPVPSPARKTL
jgi:hypothetical protein